MKSRYGKMPQKQRHTDDRCCISSTLLLCAAVSSLKHQPRVISGAAGAPCVNTANQTDLCWGVWCLWPNPWPFSECVRLNVRACKRRVCRGSRTPFAERAKDERILIRDTRLEKKKKKDEKKFESGKKKTDFLLWSGGAKDSVTREQACNKRNWVEETKVTETRRFSTSTALKRCCFLLQIYRCKINCADNIAHSAAMHSRTNCIYLMACITSAWIQKLLGGTHGLSSSQIIFKNSIQFLVFA